MQPSRVSFCTYYSLKYLFIFIIHYSFKNLSGFAGLFRGPGEVRKPRLPGLRSKQDGAWKAKCPY